MQECLSIYCASKASHQRLLFNYSANVLNLNDDHRVRVYSPAEPNSLCISSESDEFTLDIAELLKHLDSQWLGHTLVYQERTPTTQQTLRNTVPWCEQGWVAVTGNQTSGRGRRGTIWTSPAGSVALSIALRIEMQHAQRLTFIQYIAALAAVDAVKHPDWEGMQLRVKWPNDIFKDGLKVGGVLCEAVLRNGVFHVVVGVGVNVTNAKPTTCLMPDRKGYFREMFVGQYLTAFERLYEQFCERGFELTLREKYLDVWLHTDQKVRLGHGDGPTATVKGLAPNGWVRVFRDDLQAFQDLPPENTSLDLERSVIKDKGNS